MIVSRFPAKTPSPRPSTLGTFLSGLAGGFSKRLDEDYARKEQEKVSNRQMLTKLILGDIEERGDYMTPDEIKQRVNALDQITGAKKGTHAQLLGAGHKLYNYIDEQSKSKSSQIPASVSSQLQTLDQSSTPDMVSNENTMEEPDVPTSQTPSSTSTTSIQHPPVSLDKQYAPAELEPKTFAPIPTQVSDNYSIDTRLPVSQRGPDLVARRKLSSDLAEMKARGQLTQEQAEAAYDRHIQKIKDLQNTEEFKSLSPEEQRRAILYMRTQGITGTGGLDLDRYQRSVGGGTFSPQQYVLPNGSYVTVFPTKEGGYLWQNPDTGQTEPYTLPNGSIRMFVPQTNVQTDLNGNMIIVDRASKQATPITDAKGRTVKSAQPTTTVMINGIPTNVPRSDSYYKPAAKTIYTLGGVPSTGGTQGISLTPPQKVESTTEQTLADLSSARTLMKQTISQVDKLGPSTLGVVRGKISALSANYLGGLGLSPDQYKMTRNFINLIKTNAFAEGGKNLTGNEKQFFLELLPRAESDSLMSAKAKLEQAYQYLNSRIKTRWDSLSESDRMQLGRIGKDLGVSSNAETKTINGVLYEKGEGGWRKVKK